jgi:hypothetical protein
MQGQMKRKTKLSLKLPQMLSGVVLMRKNNSKVMRRTW